MYHSTGRVGISAIFCPTLPVGHQIYCSTGRVGKSAIFGPTLLMGQQMCFSTGCLWKSACFCSTLSVGHQMCNTTGGIGQSAIFCHSRPVGHQMYCSTVLLAESAISIFFVIGPPNVLSTVRLTDWCNFWPYFVSGPPNARMDVNTSKRRYHFLIVFTSSLYWLSSVCIVRMLKVDFYIGKIITAAVLTGPFHSLLHFKANGLY